MLILIYLICILKQTESSTLGDHTDVYPMENSQKLMLTIPTELSCDLENLPSSTPAITNNIDNSISKTLIDNEQESSGLEEEDTTPLFVPDQISESDFENAETTETVITPASSVPFKRSLSINELKMFDHTTIKNNENILSTTTTPKEDSIELLIQEKENSLRQQEESRQQKESRQQEESRQQKESRQQEESTTNKDTSQTTEASIKVLQSQISTPTSTPYLTVIGSDDLFRDNWQSHSSDDVSQTNSLEFSTQLEGINDPAESFFLNVDNEFGAMEAPIFKTVSSNIPTKDDNLLPIKGTESIHEDLEYSDGDFTQNKMISSSETHPIFSPRNLFNLFSFDHHPASSDMTSTWWPSARTSSAHISPGAFARRTNDIVPNEETEQNNGGRGIFNRMRQLQKIDFNTKLKDSVNILEKLFENFLH